MALADEIEVACRKSKAKRIRTQPGRSAPSGRGICAAGVAPGGHRGGRGAGALLTWHVVNGKNGLSVWQQKRAEDRQLQKEIKDLQQENARLREHVERLKSDPDAIEHEAREKLHYAKPGEVIYTLPPEPQNARRSRPGAGK